MLPMCRSLLSDHRILRSLRSRSSGISKSSKEAATRGTCKPSMPCVTVCRAEGGTPGHCGSTKCVDIPMKIHQGMRVNIFACVEAGPLLSWDWEARCSENSVERFAEIGLCTCYHEVASKKCEDSFSIVGMNKATYVWPLWFNQLQQLKCKDCQQTRSIFPNEVGRKMCILTVPATVRRITNATQQCADPQCRTSVAVQQLRSQLHQNPSHEGRRKHTCGICGLTSSP
jgi:hypothetical protein